MYQDTLTYKVGNSIVLVKNDTNRMKFCSIELRYYDELNLYSTYIISDISRPYHYDFIKLVGYDSLYKYSRFVPLLKYRRLKIERIRQRCLQ